MSDRRFRFGVGVIGVLALVVRVTVVARIRSGEAIWGDQLDYYWGANALVHGDGFTSVLATVRFGSPVASAAHPPGYTLFLAALRDLGFQGIQAQRYATALLGVATVLVVVALGTGLSGRRAGLIAGFVAAIYPQLWINDTMLMSEALFTFGFALGLLGVYRYHRSPTAAWLVTGMVGLTLAASARAESLLLFPLVALPLVFARRSVPWRRRLAHLSVAVLVPLVMLVPWFAYNSSRFAEPVLFTTGLGRAMRQGNCIPAYSGRLIGSYVGACLETDPPPPPPRSKAPDESVEDAYFRDRSWTFMSSHRSELTAVVLAREGRLLGLWRPRQQNVIDHYNEGRGPMWVVTWAQRATWVLGVVALAGFWILRRRRIPLYPMLAEVAVTVLVAAVTFGNTRYRAGVEVCIVVLVAAAIDGAWRRFGVRSSPPRSRARTPVNR